MPPPPEMGMSLDSSPLLVTPVSPPTALPTLKPNPDVSAVAGRGAVDVDVVSVVVVRGAGLGVGTAERVEPPEAEAEDTTGAEAVGGNKEEGLRLYTFVCGDVPDPEWTTNTVG